MATMKQSSSSTIRAGEGVAGDGGRPSYTRSTSKAACRTDICQEHVYYTSSIGEYKSSVIDYSLRDLRNSNDRKTIIVMLFGFINSVFPELAELMEPVLKANGINPVPYVIPTQSDADPSFDKERTNPKINLLMIQAWFSMIVLVIFKKRTKSTYTAYMKNRFRALTGVLGLNDDKMPEFIFNFQQASYINQAFDDFDSGSDFKKELIYFILDFDNNTKLLGNAAKYLRHILEYNEMQGLVCIRDVFLITESPALNVAEVRDEVKNAKRAFEAIDSSEHPEFYKYLCDPKDLKLLHRKNFPTIMDAAQQYKMESTGQTQFFPTDSLNNPLVKKLKTVHKEFCDERFNSLMNFDETTLKSFPKDTVETYESLLRNASMLFSNK